MTKRKNAAIDPRSTIVSYAMVKKVLANAANTETPDGRLWLAVILQAITDLYSKGGKDKYGAEFAAFVTCRWFEQVCELCDLDCAFAREIIALIGVRRKVI